MRVLAAIIGIWIGMYFAFPERKYLPPTPAEEAQLKAAAARAVDLMMQKVTP